ncbi:MAG: HAD family hydrolase [Halioglobus sp.]
MKRLQINCLLALFLLSAGAIAGEPLPSWNDSNARAAIVSFVTKVTQPGGEHYVLPEERIATFDNDGTLWAEQPLYFQAIFAFDQVRAMAPQHPEWKDQEPFASVLKGDNAGALAGGTKSLLQLVMASHAGMSVQDFGDTVVSWLNEARHPTTGRRYDQMVYQPMLELLDYLRANGFRTYITSGGGIEFMRPWVEGVYGIPPEQVIGSSIRTQYKVIDGEPQLLRLPEMNFIDDKEGKPVAINQHIGRRPIMAVGNSDGDFQMLEWTTAGEGLRFGLFIHHTDAEREWAYDRESHIGRLNRGLDEAPARGWTVVDMKKDWKVVFPPLKQ